MISKAKKRYKTIGENSTHPKEGMTVIDLKGLSPEDQLRVQGASEILIDIYEIGTGMLFLIGLFCAAIAWPFYKMMDISSRAKIWDKTPIK